MSSASRAAALEAFNCASALRSVIQPHFLRRSKQSIKTHIQLPPKQEQVKLIMFQKTIRVSHKYIEFSFLFKFLCLKYIVKWSNKTAFVLSLLNLYFFVLQVLFCNLSPAQFQIYVEFLESNQLSTVSRHQPKQHRPNNVQVFFSLSVLRKICNHPDLLLLHEPIENHPIDFGSPLR